MGIFYLTPIFVFLAVGWKRVWDTRKPAHYGNERALFYHSDDLALRHDDYQIFFFNFFAFLELHF